MADYENQYISKYVKYYSDAYFANKKDATFTDKKLYSEELIQQAQLILKDQWILIKSEKDQEKETKLRNLQ